jgi:tetratricopeptide (TPR) repeat protein
MKPRALAALLLSAALLTGAPVGRLAADDRPTVLRRLVRKVGQTLTAGPKQPSTTQPADTSTVEGCRKLYQAGRYDRAIEGYRGHLDDPNALPAAAIGLADALAITGRVHEAIRVLESVQDVAADHAGWHLALARHRKTIGAYEAALGHARTARRLRPLWAPAIFLQGRLLETLGRRDPALTTYRDMEKVIDQGGYDDDAQTLVALGLILDRYAVLSGMRSSDQASNILRNYLQQAYLRADKTYWPAHVAAGQFLLDKSRPKSAAQEFSQAAKINPNIPAVHVGIGRILLDQWNWEGVFKQVDKALAIDPNCADAHVLRALAMMQRRKFAQALEPLGKALETNPNHLEALSLLAAAHIRLDQRESADRYAGRVRAINPRHVGLPNAIGQWLSAGRQYDQAEAYFLRAVALEPNAAEPLANLGQMYMQTGEEDKAREVLDQAHALDDFRADVVNYLRLLEQMSRYQVRQTEHFIIKADPRRDAVLIDQVAEFMERIHPEVCQDFGHWPADKTIVEIMPTHSAFSVRITGRGWIGTVGACTGRVIALAPPTPERERSQFGTHNWATVLRHEYTHTVTLSATGNRIPHWFTEACAVWQQPDRRNYQATQALVGATRTGRLFDIDDLDWGFIRPKRRGDRSLAYAQSEWMLEYLITTNGFGIVAEMLQGFGDGLSQKEVFESVVGVSEAEFDQAFRQWAREQVRQWGFNPEPPPEIQAAAAAVKQRPDDPNAHADLAVALYSRGQAPRAQRPARRALELQPDNERALAVLSSILVARKQWAEAITHARRLEEVNPASPVAPRVLAECHLAERNWIQAISALEALKQRQPLDPYSYQQLARIYAQFGQTDRALPNLIELHRRTMKDPKYARQVAEIYRSMGKHDLALEYFQQITYINPYEASAYQAMAAIHLRARRYVEAIDAVENVCLLQPEAANSWNLLAAVRYRTGRAAGDRRQLLSAKEAVDKALRIAPDNPASQRTLMMIEAALEDLPAPADTPEQTAPVAG